MSLRPGLRLWLPPGDDPAARVALSRGVVPPPAELAARYAPGAFVPLEPWHPPDGAEAASLLARPADAAENTAWLAVVRLPADILAPFARLRALAPEGADAVVAVLKSDPHQEAIDGVKGYVRRFAAPGAGPFAESGIAVAPAGLPTTTAGADRTLIGLHVDSWYRYPIADRTHSPNRIAVNLGPEDRYFLYVNQPLAELARVLAEVGSAVGADDGAVPELRRRFFARFPGYPVVRVRLGPGDAYIAPTENLLHDGCTIGKTVADLNLSIRGQFGHDRVRNPDSPG